MSERHRLIPSGWHHVSRRSQYHVSKTPSDLGVSVIMEEAVASHEVSDNAEARALLDSAPVRQRSPKRHYAPEPAAVAAALAPEPRKDPTSSGVTVGRPSARLLQWFQVTRNRTNVLVNLSAIMERTDEQLLPSVYLFVASSFSATPKQLGYLTLCRALAQAFSSPLGGVSGA